MWAEQIFRHCDAAGFPLSSAALVADPRGPGRDRGADPAGAHLCRSAVSRPGGASLSRTALLHRYRCRTVCDVRSPGSIAAQSTRLLVHHCGGTQLRHLVPGSFGCTGSIPGAPPGIDKIGWIAGDTRVHYDWTLAVRFPPSHGSIPIPPLSYISVEGTSCATTVDLGTYCERGPFRFLITPTHTWLNGT